MVIAQIVVTAIFSLQWIIMYMYFVITINDSRSIEQNVLIYFFLGLTNNIYYLNNVKSFYVSILTSRLFRQTFVKAVINLLPRNRRPRLMVSRTNQSINTVTRVRRAADPSRL
jgi:hypothetical protein